MASEMVDVGTVPSNVAGNRDNCEAMLETAWNHIQSDASSTARDSKCDEGDHHKDVKTTTATACKDVLNESHLDKDFTETMVVACKQIECLIRSGLDAFYRAENAMTESKLLLDEAKQTDLEIDRLRSAEERNSTSLVVSHV